jgi:hypothetical protein
LQHPPCLPANLLGSYPQLPQNIQGDAFTKTDQPKQQVLGTDVVMTHAARFFNGKF